MKTIDGDQANPGDTRAVLADSDSEVAKFKTICSGYTERGFVVNDTELAGNVLLLPRSSLLWKPTSFDEVFTTMHSLQLCISGKPHCPNLQLVCSAAQVTPESLALIGIMDPPVEMLLIGTGDKARRPSAALSAHFQAKGIVVEQTTTANAIATFNILNAEDRLVAAALLLPEAA